jgi:3-methyladenine DNA glycosylase AlkD
MTVSQIAGEIAAAVNRLTDRNTKNLRNVRKEYSRRLRDEKPDIIIGVAKALIRELGVPNFIGYELIEFHKETAKRITQTDIADLSRDLDSWWTVDAFACSLSGIAWRNGQISDDLIHSWACSDTVWVRRAALASTIPLNNRTRGGKGDPARTLEVCTRLVADREPMVYKALSWALRELAKREAAPVIDFVNEHEASLHPQVKREVMTKLTTGKKNPARTPQQK